MDKLRSGLRQISYVQAGVVATVLVGMLALLLFGLDARSTAKDSQAVAQHAVNTERAILEAIVIGCEARTTYDGQSLALAKNVHDFGTALDAVVSETVIPPGTDATTRKLFEDEKKAIHALAMDSASIASRSVINNCGKYKKLLTTIAAGTDSGNGG